jgi:hypothetical protein
MLTINMLLSPDRHDVRGLTRLAHTEALTDLSSRLDVIESRIAYMSRPERETVNRPIYTSRSIVLRSMHYASTCKRLCIHKQFLRLL